MTRDEHITWAKNRAMEYLRNDLNLRLAFVSMISDLAKHDETRNHPGIEIGTAMLLGGHLNSLEEMRRFIEGFN